MKILRILTLLILVITTPTLLATPSQNIVLAKNSSKKLHKNFKKYERYHLLTYDQILTLLHEVESGKAEKRYKEKNLRKINLFLVYLANEGAMSNSENVLALQADSRDLLDFEDEYVVTLASNLDPILCGWFSSSWKKTKNFVKNHKKEILIGAAIVVATTIVVVAVIGASSAGAAAALAGAAGATSDQKEPPNVDIPTLLEDVEETECLSTAVREHVSELKEFIAEDIVIQTTDVEREATFGEKARELGAYFAHETLEEIAELASLLPQFSQELNDLGEKVIPGERSSDPYENYHNLVAQGHKMIDGIFSTELSDIYSEEAKAQKPLNEYVIGELPPPGSFSRGLKTGKLSKALEAGKETTVIAEELGYTAKEIADMEKAGTLKKTISKISENQKIAKSIENSRNIKKVLAEYQGRYMAEGEVRRLIHNTGTKTFPRPKGIPKNYRVKLSDKGAGMKYVHPTNEGTYVRVMPGSSHSCNSSQQKPYVNHRIHGSSVDKYGNFVSNKSLEAHIPLEEFVFRDR